MEDKVLMLLRAAEYIESTNPKVVGSEHDYASNIRNVPSAISTRESRHLRELTNEKRSGLRLRSTTTTSRVRNRPSSKTTEEDTPSTHNQLEKIRRHNMRSCFDQLKCMIISCLKEKQARDKTRISSLSSPSLPPSPSFLRRTSSQQILNLAYNLLKDLENEHKALEKEKWKVMKNQATLKGRLIGFQSIPDKVIRSRSTNSSSGRSSYSSSTEFIDVTSDSASLTSEDSGFAMSLG